MHVCIARLIFDVPVGADTHEIPTQWATICVSKNSLVLKNMPVDDNFVAYSCGGSRSIQLRSLLFRCAEPDLRTQDTLYLIA